MDLSRNRLVSSLLALRTSQRLFPFSLPTAGFPRGMADLLGALFHFLPSLTPPTPAVLSPTSTNASSYLVTRALFFPLTAHRDDIIPSHMASSCSTFHNTRTRACAAHTQSPAGPSVKPSSLSYRPTVVRRGPPLA